MAKLTRVTGKVFGGSAPLDEIGVFGSAKAGDPTNSQDVATIQSLSAYANGWGSAILTSRNFPPIEEVTGVLKTISYQNCYLLQEGIPEYDANTNYSNTSIVKNIDGQTLSFFISLKNDNIGNPLTDGTSWLKANLNSARNIGEIITSAIPLSDSGVHLLDGALINGSGIYKDFVDYIASIYNSSLNYFCSEVEWQTSVSTYGSCGKFVYTAAVGANPATVRLPKVSDILEGTTDIAALGDLTEAGLPNITGELGRSSRGLNSGMAASGAIYIGGGTTYGDYGESGGNWIGFDASRSSDIYGNSSTVQPQTVKVLYYIVLANSTKTDIEVDIDEIAADLNGKADVDFTNVNDSGTSLAAGWALPSETYVDLTLGVSEATYTAPANGWVGFTITANGTSQAWITALVTADNSFLWTSKVIANTTDQVLDVYIPVLKNQSFEVGYINCKTFGSDARDRFRFYYALGSESEAE